MFSLTERFDSLVNDLLAQPMRITSDPGLPFAIIQYEPSEEWVMRHELRRAITRLEQSGRHGHRISLAELLWQIIDGCEGIDAVIALERRRGFFIAQNQIATYLSDNEWEPNAYTLVDTLAQRLAPLNPLVDVAFLWRATALAPNHYFLSKLLDEMRDKAKTPTILLYPGSLEGLSALRFMGMQDRDALGNYRVKIYGQEINQ